MNQPANTTWGPPAQEPDISGDRQGRTEYDLNRWRMLTAQVAEAGRRNNYSRAQAARLMNMPTGTFSQWYSGKYDGRLDEQNRIAAIWIESLEEAGAFARQLVQAPKFLNTRTAIEFGQGLGLSHQLGAFVIITAEAGLGKTAAFRNYVETRPHAHLVTMRPHTKTVHGMLVEIAASLGITQHNPAQLDRTIGVYLARAQAPTLLIIDEAQNLVDQAVDQLRYFSDEHGIGVVLGGNTEIYGRFSARQDGPSYAQIKRRVAKRIKRIKPYREDIQMLISAWGVEDPDMTAFLTGIGGKPGALGNINQTMRMATAMAIGAQEELSKALLKQAWEDRAMEDAA